MSGLDISIGGIPYTILPPMFSTSPYSVVEWLYIVVVQHVVQHVGNIVTVPDKVLDIHDRSIITCD